MKKFLFGFVIAISGLSMTRADAQNYCCPPQNVDPCCCCADFNGIYIGGNLGVFTHTAHRNDLDGHLTDNSGWSHNETDVTAGLQLGWDWQCCNKLFGLVADWNWVNTERRLRNNPNVTPDSFIHSEFDWFTTIRARAGLAVCDALVYITGGAVVARFDTRWRDGVDDFRFHNTRWGWVGGFGAEFILMCNWSVGAEILHLHFAEHTKTFTSTDGTDFSFGHSDSGWVGRLFVNWRFGDLFSCCCR